MKRNAGQQTAGGTGEARKYFFFEKKKQKTLILLVDAADTSGMNSIRIKFLGSFFQKRTASFALAFPRQIKRLSE
jgi:hypothetical protein